MKFAAIIALVALAFTATLAAPSMKVNQVTIRKASIRTELPDNLNQLLAATRIQLASALSDAREKLAAILGAPEVPDVVAAAIQAILEPAVVKISDVVLGAVSDIPSSGSSEAALDIISDAIANAGTIIEAARQQITESSGASAALIVQLEDLLAEVSANVQAALATLIGALGGSPASIRTELPDNLDQLLDTVQSELASLLLAAREDLAAILGAPEVPADIAAKIQALLQEAAAQISEVVLGTVSEIPSSGSSEEALNVVNTAISIAGIIIEANRQEILASGASAELIEQLEALLAEVSANVQTALAPLIGALGGSPASIRTELPDNLNQLIATARTELARLLSAASEELAALLGASEVPADVAAAIQAILAPAVVQVSEVVLGAVSDIPSSGSSEAALDIISDAIASAKTIIADAKQKIIESSGASAELIAELEVLLAKVTANVQAALAPLIGALGGSPASIRTELPDNLDQLLDAIRIDLARVLSDAREELAAILGAPEVPGDVAANIRNILEPAVAQISQAVLGAVSAIPSSGSSEGALDIVNYAFANAKAIIEATRQLIRASSGASAGLIQQLEALLAKVSSQVTAILAPLIGALGGSPGKVAPLDAAEDLNAAIAALLASASASAQRAQAALEAVVLENAPELLQPVQDAVQRAVENIDVQVRAAAAALAQAATLDEALLIAGGLLAQVDGTVNGFVGEVETIVAGSGIVGQVQEIVNQLDAELQAAVQAFLAAVAPLLPSISVKIAPLVL